MRFVDDPEIAALVRKGKGYSESDQQVVIGKQREFLAQVLPAYRAAAQGGGIDISASPFYHPILLLLCDTDLGRVSSPRARIAGYNVGPVGCRPIACPIPCRRRSVS